ncbi:MAG: BMP family ABC transporter substrate-binding protein [Blautia sp.]
MRPQREFPDVQFCHATGTKAHTEGLDNFHNAFASIYEGRYLAGITAGMKLNEMIANGEITEDQAKMGYVGAYTYAEVISGYTSFFLGARSVCPSVTMEVTFTGSWYDETAEKEGANKLIDDGCVLISQHADSMGAPTACETAGVPNVSYNGSTESACPNTFLVSSRINWAPYFEYAMGCVESGDAIDADWTGDLKTGSVELTSLGKAVAEGTQEAIDEAAAKLEDGSLHVFDISTFTVDGKTLDSTWQTWIQMLIMKETMRQFLTDISMSPQRASVQLLISMFRSMVLPFWIHSSDSAKTERGGAALSQHRPFVRYNR